MFVDPEGLLPVMLDYIVEKNGGVVADYYDGGIYVAINGTENTYFIGQHWKGVEIINGQYIIDSDVLEMDFGISYPRSNHEPGDTFHSMEDAAMAWGFTYNLGSAAKDKEYASLIYEKSDGYYFGDKIVGEEKFIDFSSISTNTASAIIHSHGKANPKNFDENFSDDDIMLSINRGIPIYLVTPSGVLKGYNLKGTHTISTICSGFPRIKH